MRFPAPVPTTVSLPGYRTTAQVGKLADGLELFLPICSLQCSGVRDVVLSRWMVGGESSALLTREYAQELPFIGPVKSMQRAKALLRRAELDPSAEPSLKAADQERESLTGDEPFFWSGYLVASTFTPDEEKPE